MMKSKLGMCTFTICRYKNVFNLEIVLVETPTQDPTINSQLN